MNEPDSLYALCVRAAERVAPAFTANGWSFSPQLVDDLIDTLTELASHVVDQDGTYACAESGHMGIERMVDEDGVQWRVFLDLGSWFPD